MPIEVRELVIKGRMKEDNSSDIKENGTGISEEERQSMMQQLKEEVVKECMDELKKLLKKQKER